MRRLLAAALLGVAGCVAAEKQPEPAGLEARKARLAACERDPSYEGNWQAASLCSDLADEDLDHLPRDERERFARLGKQHAETAIAMKDGGVEGHYFRAISIGRVLTAERLPSFSLVSVLRDEGERAAALDEEFEHAGAHRLLGILYCEAPGWGPGGVGDEDKAEEHFLAALRIAGEWPENLLAYAKHLLKDDRSERAHELINKAVKILEGPCDLDDQQKRAIRLQIAELLKK